MCHFVIYKFYNVGTFMGDFWLADAKHVLIYIDAFAVVYLPTGSPTSYDETCVSNHALD